MAGLKQWKEEEELTNEIISEDTIEKEESNRNLSAVNFGNARQTSEDYSQGTSSIPNTEFDHADSSNIESAITSTSNITLSHANTMENSTGRTPQYDAPAYSTLNEQTVKTTYDIPSSTEKVFAKTVNLNEVENYGSDQPVCTASLSSTEASSYRSAKSARTATMAARSGLSSQESFDETTEEMITAENIQSNQLNPTYQSERHLGYATETKTAETEQLFSSVQEEKKTFFIRSVIDPRNDERISMQQAIVLGIINPDTGSYVNIDTGETIPIPEAMSQGKIEVSFASTNRGREKKSTIGIITVKTKREKQRAYKIKTVTNTGSNERLSIGEAIKEGIINDDRGTYIDSVSKKEMLILDAVKASFIDIEYTEPEQQPEEVVKKYAVRAVVDRRNKKIITFQDAVSRKIIDKDAGTYYDTETAKSMYIGDAIMKGFLKARVIDSTETLNIDPENQMVIDKTETIRKKLLGPLKVIRAFKKAAAFSVPIKK